MMTGMILLIFAAIFFIAPVVVIVLIIMNQSSKRKMNQLNKPADMNGQREGAVVSRIDYIARHQQSRSATVHVAQVQNRASAAPAPAPARKKLDKKAFQGTAALIIGVIFVVLAGLIFTTTTWYTLPSFSKVVLIFGFALLFFGTSWLADKIFKIAKTSQAFYILGSVFLFLTILAAGYFKLLGYGFTMEEHHRFKVLCAGSLVTELALLMGMRRFRDTVYTKACFWGMTVSVYFFIKAINLGFLDSIKVIAYYAVLLLFADEFIISKKEKLPVYLKAGFSAFARIHFWLISIPVVFIAIGEWHVFIIGHLFRGSAAAAWSTAAALGMLAAGFGVMILRQQRQNLRIFYNILMVMFLQYLGMCIPAAFIYQTFAGALLIGGWFVAVVEKGGRLQGGLEDYVSLLTILFDTLAILAITFINWNSISEFLAASLIVVFLAALVTYRSPGHPSVRPLIPIILYPLTITVYGGLGLAGMASLNYYFILLLFLAVIAVWDLGKQDHFGLAILIMGSLAQLLVWLTGRSFHGFPLFLSGYLLLKSFQLEGDLKALSEKGSCLYLLAGVFLITDSVTAVMMQRTLFVTVAFVAEYAVLNRFRQEAFKHSFWEVTGVILLIANMMTFYLNGSLSWVYLVLCLVVFTAFYVTFYRQGSLWTQLLSALTVLPMPLVLAERYILTENQLYGFTALAILLSGLAARRLVPIITSAGEDSKFDWLQILMIFIIAPMILTANDSWRCAYIVLLAGYVLEYTSVPKLQKSALTIAAALGVVAFWVQPFIQYPEVFYLEIQLLPVVLFSWLLAYIWRGQRSIQALRFIISCGCLLLLTVDALCTGLVSDALILEMVCLAIFIWANMKKHVIWLRISGIIIVLAALYMTKDFWLSLSWWVYLLAAGLGLIVFAGVNEVKKK